MNTMFMGDTYGHHEALLLPRGDMIIHAGNITKNGTEAEVRDFLEWFSHLNYKYRILIAGPRDKFIEEEPAKLKRMMPPTVCYLQDSGIEIAGFNLWGTPFHSDNHGSAFSLPVENLKSRWDMIPDDSSIVISRTTAFGVHDQDDSGKHTGCKDLLRRLVRITPSYFVCGNAHGDHHYEFKHQINFINASLLNQEYKVTHKPVFLRNP